MSDARSEEASSVSYRLFVRMEEQRDAPHCWTHPGRESCWHGLDVNYVVCFIKYYPRMLGALQEPHHHLLYLGQVNPSLPLAVQSSFWDLSLAMCGLARAQIMSLTQWTGSGGLASRVMAMSEWSQLSLSNPG